MEGKAVVVRGGGGVWFAVFHSYRYNSQSALSMATMPPLRPVAVQVQGQSLAPSSKRGLARYNVARW